MPCFVLGAMQCSTKRLQSLSKGSNHRQSAKEDGLTTVQNSVSTKEVFHTKWNPQNRLQAEITGRLLTLLQRLLQKLGSSLGVRNMVKEWPQHPIRKRYRIPTDMPTTTITRVNTLWQKHNGAGDRSLASAPNTIEVVKYRSHEDCF